MKTSALTHVFLGVTIGIMLLGLHTPAGAAVTGDLQVEIRDAEGYHLPGATVAIRGPAQPGERATVTRERGVARFNLLTPGVYEIRVSMPGYATIVYDDVQVTLDETRAVKINLPGELTYDVTVDAEIPLVNVRSTKLGLSLRPELVDAVPTSNNYIARAEIAPGVDPGNNPMVHGARHSDNLYLVDGINTTDPVTGTWGAGLDYESVEQQDIVTAGHGAEYGSVVGMTSNLITKSGGNELSGSLFTQYRTKNWYSSTDPDAIGSRSSDILEYTLTMGGPVVKDRVWWFASYRTYRLDTATLVEDGAEPRPDLEYDVDGLFGKLTWNITRNQTLVGQFVNNDEVIYNYGASTITTNPDQFSRQNQPGKNSALRHTAILGPNLMLQSQVSFHRSDLDRVPQYPELGPNVSNFFDSDVQFGRYRSSYVSNRDRDEFRSDLTWFVPSTFGDHNLKFGLQYQDTEYGYTSTPSGGERFIDLPSSGNSLWDLYGPGNSMLFRWLGLESNNPSWECRLGGLPCSEQPAGPSEFSDPADWQMVVDGVPYTPADFTFTEPSVDGSAADIGWVRHMRYATTDIGSVGSVGRRISSIYAHDEWSRNRLAVTLGLRLERVEMRNSRGEHSFSFDTTLAPRLGVSYDLRGDGRQKVFATYGRYYDPIRDNLSAFAGQYGSPRNEWQYWFAPAGQYHSFYSSGGEGSASAVVSPRVKTPYTDSVVLGYAVDLGGQKSLEISLLEHRTRDLVDDFDPATGTPDPVLYPNIAGHPTLEELGFSDRDGDGVIDGEDIDAAFVIYNPPGAVRDYRGFDLVFTKRLLENWQAIASYSYADATGSQTSDSLAGAIGDDPYRDPRLWFNQGKLDTRKHSVKLYGSYRLPLGFEIGAAVNVRSGSHYSLGVRSPDYGAGYWNGDPARIVDTLPIDRDAFATALGIPASLPKGSRNPALDEAIMDLVPLDFRAGRGRYENPWFYQLDLRLRYWLRLGKIGTYEAYVDIFNVLNRQDRVTEDGNLNTRIDPETGNQIPVTVKNIGDREIYSFQQPLSSQAPRKFLLGMRVSF